jgi:hypothetical protein
VTVKPGEDWGRRQELPGDAVIASSDHELATLLGAGTAQPVVLRGGDLFRTVGAPRPESTATRLPVDVLRVRADDRDLVAVAHVVGRGGGCLGWWRGPIVAVMNAEFLGRWDAAPRAHPNDGRFDALVVAASMPPRARWQVWRRLPSGSHLPHPAIAASRGTSQSWHFERPLTLFADGHRIGPVHDLTVRVDPDAATIWV